MLPFAPVITGPTASGKTGLAIELAERLGVDILSLDSRQVYRGLETATAAPTEEERARVRHHLVSVVSPHIDYSAGSFCADAREVLGLPTVNQAADGMVCDTAAAEPALLFCGGSGFYLRAFLDPVHPSLGSRPETRSEVKALADQLGPAAFRRHVVEQDPEAAWIPEGDRNKLERYLEISLSTGVPASRAMRELVLPRPVESLVFVLHTSLDWLMPRIRARAWSMLKGGMIDEIREALEDGVSPRSNSLRSVGASEVMDLLAARMDLQRCKERISRSTRQYARKQLTWGRNIEGAVFLSAEAPRDELLERMLREIDARVLARRQRSC